MRQIYVCACLLVVSVAVAACGGEQFTSGEQGSAENNDAEGGNDSVSLDAGAAGSSTPGTGGSATSGGTSNTGAFTSGGSSAGGKSGGGSTTGGASESCTTGAVTLKMLPAPDLPADYLCDAGCGTGWLTITDARGAVAFSLFSGCGSVSCSSCSQQPCAAAACLPTPLTAEGSKLTWTGTYLAQDACGANMMACQRPDCVPPGRYRAKACAALSGGASDMAGGGCTPKNVQVCAEAEFDFPGTSEVDLILRKQ